MKKLNKVSGGFIGSENDRSKLKLFGEQTELTGGNFNNLHAVEADNMYYSNNLELNRNRENTITNIVKKTNVF